MSRGLLVSGAAAVTRSGLSRWEVRRAVRQARRLSRRCDAQVGVCWDLDNTLVGSGTLINAGMQLQEAIVEAEPVPNMLSFFESIRDRLPGADHFVLSARVRSMRESTFAWMQRHGLELDQAAVCLVPDAEAKRRIWAELARGRRLLIVDDLSYDHESERVSVYEDLVAFARRTASVYIGLDEIAELSEDPAAVDAIASRAAESLLSGGRSPAGRG